MLNVLVMLDGKVCSSKTYIPSGFFSLSHTFANALSIGAQWLPAEKFSAPRWER